MCVSWRRAVGRTLAAVAVGWALGSPMALQAQATAASAAVEARELAFAKTMADRDFEAFLTFVAEEAIFFDGEVPHRGRAAIAALWAPFFEGDAAPFSWRPDRVEALDSGELALSTGPVFAPSGEQGGRFNSVWRKEADGVWRVVFDKGSN